MIKRLIFNRPRKNLQVSDVLKHINMNSVQEIKGFSVLPLKLSPNPHYITKTPAFHYIYYKKHTINSKDSDELEKASRSLFLINLPIDANLQSIKRLFGEIATGAIIESLDLSNDFDYDIDYTKLTTDLVLSTNKTEKTFKLPKTCGILTFLDKSAVNLALQTLKKITKSITEKEESNKLIPIWKNESQLSGSAYFLKKYQDQILNASELSDLVSKSMVEFDNKEKESIENLQNMKSLVDEDGFTLVVGSHRKTKSGILGRVKIAATTETENAAKTLKKKEKEDFYRFQLREKKKSEMHDILKKFQEDKERIKVMRERKRFRPY